MRFIRQKHLEEFETLEAIKKQLKEYVSKYLYEKGQPNTPSDIVQVPGVNTFENTILKVKDKL